MTDHTAHSPWDVLIVGAGPAGLMAAIAAAGEGARVVVCEQLDRAGAKLDATGGGRCNLTTTVGPETILTRFGRQGRFMQPALATMGPGALRTFFAALGVETRADDRGRVFPRSNRGRDISLALVTRCVHLGVDFQYRTRITSLRLDGTRIVGVDADTGSIDADRVIVATGGLSYPQLGATGDGYALAQQAGHAIVEPTPALVALIVTPHWLADCAGVVLSTAELTLDVPKARQKRTLGEVLITHKGLSGPAVLDVSGDVAAELTQHSRVAVHLSLLAGISADQWRQRLTQWRAQAGKKTLRKLLSAELPRSLVDALLNRLSVAAATPMAQLGRTPTDGLVDLLTHLPLEVTSTVGFDQAMVTRGGVRLKNIRPDSLSSKRVTGLYFAGEVVDLDGPTGGFNLQWAFASGYEAGIAASHSIS